MHSRPLDERPPLTGAEAGAVAAAVAAALGEVHERGLVHGALGPDRVLLDELGEVSLLPAVDPVPADLRPADDVAALGELLAWLAERAPDRPADNRRSLLRPPHAAELLKELAHRCRTEDPDDRPPARLVADVLHRSLPAAAAPVADTVPRRDPLGRRAALGSVAVAALVAGAAVPADCSPPPAVATKAEPAARWSDGVLAIGSRRYAVGELGDHVLVRRWDCGPPSVALLRRRHGDVVAFDRLPGPGEHATGRVLATVPGAQRLVTQELQDDCAGLAVAVADGSTVPLHWNEAS